MSPEEIKKIKAIESDQYPHPHTIKQCLGENLGDVVIDMIPEDLLRRMQFEGGAMPRKFGVTAKNMLLGNVKLTTAADDGVDESKALNADTIIRIGKQLVERALAEHQGKLDDILYQKVDQLQEELNQKMEEKLLQAKKKEKQKFEMEMALIVAEKNAELAKTIAAIEDCFKRQLDARLKVKTVKFRRRIAKNLMDSVRAREKRMCDEFGFRMELIRGQLFERFLDEKQEQLVRYERALAERAENQAQRLARLRASMEAEHVQELTDLELQYRILVSSSSSQTAENPDGSLAKHGDVSEVKSAAVAYHTAVLRRIELELSTKRAHLAVFAARLRHLLDGYTDFVRTSRIRPALREKQLLQTKTLVDTVKRIEKQGSPQLPEGS